MERARPADELARLLGQSPAIEAVRESIRRVVARHPGGHRLPPVLLLGETGSGKGLVASILHRMGPRAGGSFVDVNCAAIPETLIEAELFGFERGAFTDARQAKPGLFQTAHGGTIFLDEIGLLPEPLQAKLLKVLEERVVRRLGSTRNEPADAWVISATNADLAEAVQQRRFRADLYHRLAVLTLALPPLRARGADVALLSERFLEQVCADYGLPVKRFSADAQARLAAYAWPGNVRELANVVERVVLLTEEPIITGDALAALEERVPRGAPVHSIPQAPEGAPVTHDQAMRQHYLAVLEQTGWNVSRAATLLQITRNTLRARIERFGLQRPGRGAAASRPAASAERQTPLPAAATEPAPAGAAPGSSEQRGLRVDDDAPLDLALQHEVEGVVQVGEREPAADQFVEPVLAAHVEVDQHRHVGALVAGAERAAREDALLEQEHRVNRQPRARRAHADRHARAAATGRQERLLDRLRGPDDLEGEVDAAAPLKACTRATGSSFEASTRCVAPNSSAHASFRGSTSTAMIRPAPTRRAAWTVFSPTPPQPHTATLAPGGTLATLKTGPAPARTPQLTRHTTSRGASFRTGITLSSASTAWVAYPETCRK